MHIRKTDGWDYLIITAANDQQAGAYELQLKARQKNGKLPDVRNVLVAPDAGGRRVGSGGSTLQCLGEVLRREGGGEETNRALDAESLLRSLRILIVHAGGDSRRLPAYSPCGKIFVPLPGTRFGTLATVFDRLVPVFLALPASPPGAGQIVVASGDALLLFDPAGIDLSPEGITALGAPVPAEEAARHGVLCTNDDGTVRRYLQKPDLREQKSAGAIDKQGRSVLDIGVMSMDAKSASTLLRTFATPAAQSAIGSNGIDLYREICCALGTEATFQQYLASTRSSGSEVEEAVLREIYSALRTVPFNLQALDRCGFLHFGSTRQLIASGIDLVTLDGGAPPPGSVLTVTNEVRNGGRIDGVEAWVEGCRIAAPLTLRGRNVIVGVDVTEPLELPGGTCLDVCEGVDRHGQQVWFIRYYGIDDTFKSPAGTGATFCQKPLLEWLQRAGVESSQMWEPEIPERERTLWNARVFPAEKEHARYKQWRWMLDVVNATPEQIGRFLEADRYSSAEIALRADQAAFYARRVSIGANGFATR